MNTPEMTMLRIGKPYEIELPAQLAHGGAVLELFRESLSDLLINLPSIVNTEKRCLKKGDIRTGLIVQLPVIIVYFEFTYGSDVLRFDTSLNMKIVPDLMIPNIHGEDRLLVNCVAVDSNSGLTAALRSFTLAPVFTTELIQAIRQQLSMNYTSDEFAYKLLTIQNDTPLDKMSTLTNKMYPVGV